MFFPADSNSSELSRAASDVHKEEEKVNET